MESFGFERSVFFLRMAVYSSVHRIIPVSKRLLFMQVLFSSMFVQSEIVPV